ncbi:unnamed protein product [Dibothriocephalus latus]|uniref:Uncharacterized protein n=1 Tax=Dibothriocephalus latus TaxID=60516 RepID=A0A3P7NS17_DIBLA|nr:unnamed protein product [Dibothriocephalus latus]
MHWDDYTEDHLSVVSNSDYHGSVVAASHWLYWGSRHIECCSRSFSLRIIEQCDFIDDHLFTPVAKKPYTERCFATDIRVETPKVAYICKEQLGHEWKYHREVLEAGDFSVHAFVLVSDISLTGEAAHLQECFLAQATRKNGRKMDTISSLYADTNTMHLQDNSKLFYQPASSCVSEDLTYDLPVNEDADPGLGICVHGMTQLQVGTASPAAMSATTTTNVSPVSINVDVGFCETTITPSPLPHFILSKSNLPTNASVIPTAGVLDRSHRAHNHQLHRPLLQSAVSDANPEILSLTTEDSGAFQPLLLLFLHGPQASSLRSLLHAKCRLDRFQLADGRWFRIWIFDAVDALGMQISPSKWQPPHTMKPSSTAPSAFSKLMPSSCIDSARGASVSAAAESSVTAGSPSSSTASNQDGCTSDAQNDHSRRKAHSVESTNQLRLSLWVGGSSDFLATDTGQNDDATPAAIPVASAGYQLDALVWFSSQVEYLNRQALLASTSRQSSPPPIPSCSSTRLKTLDRSLDLASRVSAFAPFHSIKLVLLYASLGVFRLILQSPNGLKKYASLASELKDGFENCGLFTRRSEIHTLLSAVNLGIVK